MKKPMEKPKYLCQGYITLEPFSVDWENFKEERVPEMPVFEIIHLVPGRLVANISRLEITREEALGRIKEYLKEVCLSQIKRLEKIGETYAA